MTYYHRKRHLDEFKRLYQKILIKDCRRFPIRIVDEKDKRVVELRDHLVEAVRLMMTLRKELSKVRTGQEQNVLERQLAAVDREIDGIVYELYGLSEEETETIERATELPGLQDGKSHA